MTTIKAKSRAQRKKEKETEMYLNSKNAKSADTKKEASNTISLAPVFPIKIEAPDCGIASHLNYRCTGIKNGTTLSVVCERW